MEISNFLSDTVLFQKISVEKIDELMPRLEGRIREIPAKGVFSGTGDYMENIAMIVRGELVISRVLESGDESLIGKLYEKYVVGLDIACTTTGINPYEIYSPKGATIYEFPVKKLLQPGFLPDEIRNTMINNTIQYLANTNIRHRYKIDIISENSLRKRIMIYLETRSSKLGKREFSIPFNREELASYLCVNRSALSHELSMMKKEGLIDFKKNKFRLFSS